jgi:general secretion pathway protein L
MADWLLLRFSRSAATPSWLVADAAGRPLSACESGTLQQAAAATAGRRVAIVLSATDVLLASVELPVKGGTRASQVVPYALEEQLVGDIEEQHFALGTRDATSGRTNVAVIARSELDELLQTLRAAGIEPDTVVSEAALVPVGAQQVTLMLDADTACIAGPEVNPPAVLPAVDIATALEMSVGTDALPATTIVCVATPLDWQKHSVQVEALRSRCAALKVQLASSGLLPWLALQIGSPAAINLLQGAYAVRKGWSGEWRQWRVAAVLAAVLLVLHVGGELWSLTRLRTDERQLKLQSEEFIQTVMPGEGDVAGLRARAEQRLLSAQRVDDGTGLLSALTAIAASAAGAGSGTAIQTLQFQGGALDVKLRANDAEGLERMSQQLRAAGWRAEVTSGAATGDGYEGHIRLARG